MKLALMNIFSIEVTQTIATLLHMSDILLLYPFLCFTLLTFMSRWRVHELKGSQSQFVCGYEW